MRFLCFHGRGTNAAIFKDQTAKICDAIGQDHDFVFIDGHVVVDAIPGIGSITASHENGHFAFVPLGAEPEIYRSFFQELRDFIDSQGPFDALMGFSEGASIVFTLLTEDARRPFANFKCAILFCALPALDPDPLITQPCHLRILDPVSDKTLVHVPTAHIWSANDDVADGSAEKIKDMCDEKTRQTLVHNLGHDIPGSRSDHDLAAAVRFIERTIDSVRDV